MRASVYAVCFLFTLCFSLPALAQEGDPFAVEDPVVINPIPLDSLIELRIKSRDTTAFDYYNLYAFSYITPKTKANAEFMVAKKNDVYKNFSTAMVKLCRTREFVNSFAGTEGMPIEVGDYIEITKLNGEKQFFNFDPALPNVVYTICPPKTKDAKQH